MSTLYPWKGKDGIGGVAAVLKNEGFRTELDIHDMPKESEWVRYVTARGNLYGPAWSINDSRGFVCIEDFGPGEEVYWSFFHDEFQYILSGEAEIRYSLAPYHAEWKHTKAKAGQFYIIPTGTEMHWTITSKEPYRKLCVGRPDYLHRYPGYSNTRF